MGDGKSIFALEGGAHSDADEVPASVAIVTADPDALCIRQLYSCMPNGVGSTEWDGCVYILLSCQLTSSLATQAALTALHRQVDRYVPMLPVLELEDLAVVSPGWIARYRW